MRASFVALAACIGFVALAAPGASAGTCPASITLVKTANISSFSASGTVVTYSYEVTNTGTVKLDPVTVTDPMAGLSSITCPSTSLAAWASETCTATYTTTLADLNAGSITNTGTATGTPPSGPNVTASNCLKIPAWQSPSIAIVKAATVSSFSGPGTPVTYSYKVTNTGNVTLNPVVVTDPMANLSALSCPVTSLAAGISETCTATYTTTATDVTTALITNTGTATGQPPTGANVTASQTLIIPLTGASPPTGPSIAIVKTANISSFSGSGTLVTYSYKVTNTGNVTLNPVVVTDPMANLSALSCPVTSLAAGISETCTATYTTTATDVTTALITNTGTATGQPPTGANVTASQTLKVPYQTITIVPSLPPAVTHPAISLVKTPSISTYATVGQVVTYTYLITNTGDVSLGSDQYTVSDNKINGGAAFVCGAAQTLAVGASITCTNTYTITLSDLNSGTVTNSATATNGAQTSGAATATITASPTTTTITTTIHSSPSTIPPTKIPSSAPPMGLGGSAKVVYNSGLLGAGGSSVVAGLVLMVFMIRRRRRA